MDFIMWSPSKSWSWIFISQMTCWHLSCLHSFFIFLICCSPNASESNSLCLPVLYCKSPQGQTDEISLCDMRPTLTSDYDHICNLNYFFCVHNVEIYYCIGLRVKLLKHKRYAVCIVIQCHLTKKIWLPIWLVEWQTPSHWPSGLHWCCKNFTVCHCVVVRIGLGSH